MEAPKRNFEIIYKKWHIKTDWNFVEFQSVSFYVFLEEHNFLIESSYFATASAAPAGVKPASSASLSNFAITAS